MNNNNSKVIIPDGCKKYPKVHPDRSQLSIYEWEKLYREDLKELFDVINNQFTKTTFNYNLFVMFCYDNSTHYKL